MLAVLLGAGRFAPAEEDPAVPAAPAAPPEAASSTPAAGTQDSGADLRLARTARAGIARIQWRAAGPDPEVHERNAIIVDPQGLLLMAGAPAPPRGTLTASFSDRRTAKASVVATDPESALTLLWVPITGLPTSTIRSAAPAREGDLAVGERVLMVTGSGAIARGTVRGSDRSRELPTGRGDETTNLSCLDEAAMPAVAEDLGSPWLDGEGRVVGLLVGATGGPTPVGDGNGPLRIEPVAAYAVPARVLSIVWPLLRTERFVARSRLGVASRPLDEAVEAHVCRDCGGGLLIFGVYPDGPAERAEIRRNDIVLGVDGMRIRRGMSLADALLPHRPGARVRLDILRRGEPVSVEATLGARTDD